MAKSNSEHDDEIDLVELFTSLWRGKWVIIAWVVTSMGVATLYYFLVEPVYEAKIVINKKATPPILQIMNSPPNQIMMEYIESFNSQATIATWLEENDNTSFLLDHNYVKFTDVQDNSANIVVNSNAKGFIDAYFHYANHVNSQLTSEYQAISEEGLIFLNEQAEQIGSYSNFISDLMLSSNWFLKNIEEGKLVFNITKPTNSRKISANLAIIYVFSCFFGIFAGYINVVSYNKVMKWRLECAE